MNDDGSGVSQIGTSIPGWPGSWSPDGTQIAFTARGDPELCGSMPGGVYSCYFPYVIYTTTPDGAVVTRVVDYGADPAWMPQPGDAPRASFSFTCNGRTCSFDGSSSVDTGGTIISYGWNFGDGTTASGRTVSHTYVAGGYYTITLTVTDNAGATGAQSQTVFANSPPVASFTFSCNRLTCSFDGSASHDNDDGIVMWSWNFGDGTSGSKPTITHSYFKQGTYVVTLSVKDAHGATASQSSTVQVSPRRQ